MSRVLIVSRTKMKSGVCVGGINLDNNTFVRLHTDHGANLSSDAPYQIGEIWNLSLDNPWNPRCAPHVEDTMVMSAAISSKIPNISSFIQGLGIKIYTGDLSCIFEGKLNYTKAGKAFINHNAVPSHSVCFWRPDSDIIPFTNFNKLAYRYKNRIIPYVGVAEPKTIKAGTLVRMSLANWWAPEDDTTEERYYLQLSGSY